MNQGFVNDDHVKGQGEQRFETRQFDLISNEIFLPEADLYILSAMCMNWHLRWKVLIGM